MCKKVCPVCNEEHGAHARVCKCCQTVLVEYARTEEPMPAQTSPARERIMQPAYRFATTLKREDAEAGV